MKKYISEIIGTFFLVFLGTGSVLFSGDQFTIAFLFGVGLMVGIYSVGQISGGHFNPAVTIGMLVSKRIEIVESLLYIISQFVGAILATFTLKSLLGFVNIEGVEVPTSTLGQNSTTLLGNWGSFIFEVILTFIFVTIILVVTSKKYNKGNLNGLIIGGTLFGLVAFGLNVTGTSVNPARSFAPAVFVGGDSLQTIWVFLLAPIVGAIIASIFTYKYLKVDENNDELTKVSTIVNIEEDIKNETVIEKDYKKEEQVKNSDISVEPLVVNTETEHVDVDKKPLDLDKVDTESTQIDIKPKIKEEE